MTTLTSYDTKLGGVVPVGVDVESTPEGWQKLYRSADGKHVVRIEDERISPAGRIVRSNMSIRDYCVTLKIWVTHESDSKKNRMIERQFKGLHTEVVSAACDFYKGIRLLNGF